MILRCPCGGSGFNGLSDGIRHARFNLRASGAFFHREKPRQRPAYSAGSIESISSRLISATPGAPPSMPWNLLSAPSDCTLISA